MAGVTPALLDPTIDSGHRSFLAVVQHQQGWLVVATCFSIVIMDLSSWFSYSVLKLRLCYLTMQAYFCSTNELLDHDMVYK